MSVALQQNFLPGQHFPRTQDAVARKNVHHVLVAVMGKGGHGILQIRQPAPLSLRKPLVAVPIAVKYDGHVLGKQFGEQALNGGIERRPLGKLGFKHGGDVIQRAGHCRIQGNIRRGDILGGAQSAELKLVAGKREWAGPITIGQIARDIRKHGDAYLERFRAVVSGFFPVGDGADDLGKAVPEVHGQNGGRRFVGSQTVIVAGPDDPEAQVDAMPVHGTQDGGEKDEELGVPNRGFAGVQQVVPVGIAQRPVIVFA